MIVYLGMPRCASTWLYDNLKHIEPNRATVKETHYFYKSPVDLNDYCKTNILDFSTNNWSMDEFTYSLILNKMLCYGDIIEKWYKLVDPNKILIYRYSDLLANNEEFLASITKQLHIPITSIADKMLKTNRTNKYVQPMDQETTKLLQCKIILQQQIEKFEKITNIPTNFSINNLL